MERRSRLQVLLIAAGAIAVAVVLLLVLQSSADDEEDRLAETSSESTTAAVPDQPAPETEDRDEPERPEPEPEQPDVPRVEVVDGEPVGGVQEIEVESGEQIQVEVVSDTPDELHFHGYDVYVEVPGGKKPGVLDIPAEFEGVFELESHTTGALLANVSVVP